MTAPSRPQASGWSWVAPGGEGGDEQPVPTEPEPPAGAEPSRGWSHRRARREPPPLPARLTPLTLSDLLDGAWAIISCRPATVMTLSALIILPAQLLASFLIRGHGQALDTGTVVVAVLPFLREPERGSTLLTREVPLAVAVAVLSFAYSVLGAALGRLVAAWYDDTDLTVGEVLAATAPRLPALLVAWVLTAIPQLVSIYLCGIGALFVFPLFLLVAPLVTIERRGPLSAIRRSSQLVIQRYAAVVGIWLIALVLERLIDHALAGVADIVAALASDPVAQVVRPAGWAFALFVTAPSVAGLAVLLYFDLRVRAEGLDIEVDAADAFPVTGAR